MSFFLRRCGDKRILAITTVILILLLTIITQNKFDRSITTHNHKNDSNSNNNNDNNNDHRRLSPIDDASQKHAVAVLVPRTDGDMSDLCLALKSLSRHRIVPDTTPILVFYEDGFGRKNKVAIMSCTTNPTFFHEVDLRPPPSLDYDSLGETKKTSVGRIKRLATRLGRKYWGYPQMIRFWNTLLWQQPGVQQYDTIMRIDTDSCFVASSPHDIDAHLPTIPHPYVFRAMGPGLGSSVWTKNLYDTTLHYIQTRGIAPANPSLWNFVAETWNVSRTMPVVQTNFEVTRREFFQREDVVAFHEALTEGEPWGVFRWRWGDAQIRVLTVALFAREEEVLFVRHPGYLHGRGVCEEQSERPTSW